MEVVRKYFQTRASISRGPPVLAPARVYAPSASVVGATRITRFLSVTRLGPAMPRNGPEPVTGTPDGSEEWWDRGSRGFPPPTWRSDRGEVEAPRTGDQYARALPFPWRFPGVALSWVDGAVRPEILLQPSPEQLALIAARRADPRGSLRVLAFAGAGKTRSEEHTSELQSR